METHNAASEPGREVNYPVNLDIRRDVMGLLVFMLILFGFGFPIPAILIEKDITTKSDFHESRKKVKLYRAEGYEKEVWEEETVTKGSPIGQLPFMKNAPKQGPQTQVNKGEKITHFKKGKVIAYTVDHQKKNYVKQEIEGGVLLMGFMALLDCDQQGKCKPRLEPTNERKKVGSWDARKVIVRVNTFGQMTPAYQWYTKDSELLIEADRISMENVLRAFGEDPKVSSFLRSAGEAFEEIRKKYGAIVMSETSVMGSTTVEVVESVKKVNLPESFFDVPKDYSEFSAPYRQR